MSKQRSFVLGRAAQAWCAEKTRDTVMDTDLAEAFADILADAINDPCLGSGATDEDYERALTREVVSID